jgi:enamine deaminase RidA (YjgF/YER057c/UK114 family)
MTDIQRLHPTVRMHQAVIHGGIVYTAGQVAQDNPGASIAVQTNEVLARVEALLAEAGTSKARILTAYVYLADIADFEEMNRAWDAWVAQDAKPARTTIEAKLTETHYGVEVGVIAAI